MLTLGAKKQIDEITKGGCETWSSSIKFIKFLREKFPPKVGKIPKIPKNVDKIQKKKAIDNAVRKLTQIYHPDRNNTFGDDWAAISEEISKIANFLYTRDVKGM